MGRSTRQAHERNEPGSPAEEARQPLAGKRGRGKVVRMPDDDNLRMFVNLLANFILRVERARSAFFGNDIQLATVADTISIGAIWPRMSDPRFREEFRSMHKVVGVEGQRGVNALSISAATGIPRETVRRKIKQLVDRGCVLQVGRGRYVLRPGFIQQPASIAALEEVVIFAVQFINDCFANDLVRFASDEANAAAASPSRRTASSSPSRS